MDSWEKTKTVSGIVTSVVATLATVAIPIVVVVIGNEFTAALKNFTGGGGVFPAGRISG